MNTLRNKVNLIGRLGGNPEISKFDSGKKLARFSIATNESYKNKNGEWIQNTQWHNINAWGPNAEKVERVLEKGQEVVIEGKLVNTTFETKSGEKRYATNIELIDFLRLTQKEITDKK